MTARVGLLVTLAALLAFFAPLALRGEVIYPHDDAVQLGVSATPLTSETWSFRFNDQSAFFVPELHAQLHAPRSGWLATWTNAVQLGRPLTQYWGLCPGYLPLFLLAQVVDDARVLYTLLAVLTTVATGVFAFAFLRAIDIAPAVCAAVAIATATSVPMLYWLCLTVFPAGLCWTWCLLWLVTRQIDAPRPLRWVGLAFASSALLLSAYPQHIVWHALFLSLWTARRIVQRSASWPERARQTLAIGGCAAFGALCAAPVYLDVALASSRSIRAQPDVSYFVDILPSLSSASDMATQLALLFDPRLFGNPVAHDYPIECLGIALGAFAFGPFAFSWIGAGWRALRLEYALIGVCVVLTCWPAAYVFAVEHLGLGFSRSLPLWGAVVPGTICVARSADALLRQPPRARWLCLAGAGVLLAGIGIAAHWARPQGVVSIDGVPIAMASLTLVALLVVRRGWALVAASVLIAVVEGREYVLHRTPESLARQPPLVESLHERTRDGSRYAIVGEEPRNVLPPNMELALGLASPFSYDPLGSRAYLRWIERISSKGPRVVGRRFPRIADASKLGTGALEEANVSLVLSARPIQAPNLVANGRAGPFFAQRVRAPLGPLRRLEAPASVARVDGLDSVETDLRADACGSARIVDDEGDRLLLELDAQPRETLIWLARQHHPQWTAVGGRCVIVNDFYQGVLVPAGTPSVELHFRPWARWAWVAWPLFAALGAILWLRQGRRA